MLYFDTLPKVINTDAQGNSLVLTNLMARAKLQEQLLNNPMLFYTYSIQDGDTPEIIAHKYYDDPFKYWIILYSNQIMDPLWDWPLNYNKFSEYLDAKYADVAKALDVTPLEYVRTTIYQYVKITTTVDLSSDIETVTKSTIDESTYNALMPSTNTYTLPDGQKTKVSVDKDIVYLYDYESELNESKRDIKIMNSAYVKQMERQLLAVMS
jgi:hypothetical protein